MDKNKTISSYLRTRGLHLDATIIEANNDPILADAGLTREAGEMWETKEPLITMVLQARINALGDYLIKKAIPEEVMVYRQAIVEIGAIISDLRSYHAEYKRQSEPKQEDNSANTEAQLPSPKEGKESTL